MEGKEVTYSSRKSETIGSLLRAMWGTAAGFSIVICVIAVVIAFSKPSSPKSIQGVLKSHYLDLYLTEPCQESYERYAFLALCICCPLLASAAVCFLRAPLIFLACMLLAFVPVATYASAKVFDLHPLFAAVPLLLLIPAIYWPFSRRPLPNDGLDSSSESLLRVPHRISALVCGILYLAVLLLLLVPHHIPTVASLTATSHVGSYIIGPSLYYHSPGNVPALDFESHYGIGHAYVFYQVSPYFGLSKTLQAFLVFLISISILYFLSAYIVLIDWFRMPVPAFLTALMLLGASFDGIRLDLASNWPIRHPFLFVFLFASVRGLSAGRAGLGWTVAAGLVGGISLFWQTDIGIVSINAGLVFFAASWWFRGTPFSRIPVFGTMAVATFFGICLICFGPRTLSISFVTRLLEPLMLYGSGFGNQLLSWRHGWWYLYNIIGPGAALATVGIAITARSSPPILSLRYAFLASVLGLGLLFKWVNRSIDVLWMLNGGLVLVVCCWWASLAWESIAMQWLRKPSSSIFARWNNVVVVTVFGGVFWLFAALDVKFADPTHQGGSSSPLVRIWNNVNEYPSQYSRWFNHKRITALPSAITAEKTNYLRDCSRPTDRLAVIAGADWLYLTDAGRSPLFHWVQVILVHSPTLLERCVEDLHQADKVFVEDGALDYLRNFNRTTYERFMPILKKQFKIIKDYGTSWRVYQRID